MNTPVLLLVYNRPANTERVLKRLLECGITNVYISADGPKNELDRVRTEEVKECISRHPIIVREARFEETNLGCKTSVLNGINWFFSMFEEGVILEDDCLPNQAFFKFTSKLLDRYRSSSQVKMIGGNNPLGNWTCDGGHFMSRIGHIWGWATWKNRWDEFDSELPQIHDFIANKGFEKAFGPTDLAHNRKELTLQSLCGKINTWDYQWNAHILMQNGLTAVPEFNLIENIGFDKNGTHINEKPKWISTNVSNEIQEICTIPLVANREYEMEISLSQRANEAANKSSVFFRRKGKSCSEQLTIVNINSSDIGGGAEKIALNHHQNLLGLSHDSKLLVDVKKSDLDSVIEIEADWKNQLSLLKPDVIHVHNLHGCAIHLEELTQLSKTTPVLFTLHDNWLNTGSRNHPFVSNPYSLSLLNLKNWKLVLVSRIETVRNSKIRFTAPSQWMREQFFKVHKKRPFYVPNAVSIETDSNIDLPSNRYILFVANRPETNPYKDFKTLKLAWIKANKQLGPKGCDLICVGSEKEHTETTGDFQFFSIPYSDRKVVVALIKASLLVVQPSKQDNAPLTILEAHTAGKLVIGSLVGGIPEMLNSQEQQLLYEPENDDDLARKIVSTICETEINSEDDVSTIQSSESEMTEAYLGHYLEVTDG